MLENTRLGKQFRNMMKVFGVAVAVYLALTIKIGFIGEVDEVNKFDYLKMDECYVEEFEDDDEMQEEHGVTSVFQRLCI